jgi:hypothetical protein
MKKMLTLWFAAMLTVASGFAQDKMDDKKAGDKMDKMDKMDHKKSKKSKDKTDDKKSDKMDKQ